MTSDSRWMLSGLLRLFERFIVDVDLETREGRIDALVPEAIATVDEELWPILKA